MLSPKYRAPPDSQNTEEDLEVSDDEKKETDMSKAGSPRSPLDKSEVDLKPNL